MLFDVVDERLEEGMQADDRHYVALGRGRVPVFAQADAKVVVESHVNVDSIFLVGYYVFATEVQFF